MAFEQSLDCKNLFVEAFRVVQPIDTDGQADARRQTQLLADNRPARLDRRRL
jgi:hypothetical protein